MDNSSEIMFEDSIELPSFAAALEDTQEMEAELQKLVETELNYSRLVDQCIIPRDLLRQLQQEQKLYEETQRQRGELIDELAQMDQEIKKMSEEIQAKKRAKSTILKQKEQENAQNELKRTKQQLEMQRQHEQASILEVDTAKLTKQLEHRREVQQREKELLQKEINREKALIHHIETKLKELVEERHLEEKRVKKEEEEREKKNSLKLREDKIASLELSIATLHAYLEKHTK